MEIKDWRKGGTGILSSKETLRPQSYGVQILDRASANIKPEYDLINNPAVEVKTSTAEDVIADIRSMKEMFDGMDSSKLEANMLVLLVGDEKRAQEAKDAITTRDPEGELRFNGREISIVVCDSFELLTDREGFGEKLQDEGRLGKGQRKSNRQDRWK